MIIHEEPSPNSVSSPVSTAKDSRCYTVEDLMEMLLLSRPTVYRLLKQNEFRWFKVSGAYKTFCKKSFSGGNHIFHHFTVTSLQNLFSVKIGRASCRERV